jgi:hypothetical protein
MIKKYKLVTASIDKIEGEVNRAIKRGWQPFGAMVRSGESIIRCPVLNLDIETKMFTQPMVKYKEIRMDVKGSFVEVTYE